MPPFPYRRGYLCPSATVLGLVKSPLGPSELPRGTTGVNGGNSNLAPAGLSYGGASSNCNLSYSGGFILISVKSELCLWWPWTCTSWKESLLPRRVVLAMEGVEAFGFAVVYVIVDRAEVDLAWPWL